jgi:RND superfamily putative drug exporter
MASLARWCFRRRAWVLAGWLALLAILGVAGRAAGSAYSDTLTLPGTGSTAALHLEEQAFPGHAGDQDTIVWRASEGVRAPAVRARISAMLAKVAAAPGVASVISPYSARGAAQVSRDGQVAYATVVFGAQANSLPHPRSPASSISPRRPGPPACRSTWAGRQWRTRCGPRSASARLSG